MRAFYVSWGALTVSPVSDVLMFLKSSQRSRVLVLLSPVVRKPAGCCPGLDQGEGVWHTSPLAHMHAYFGWLASCGATTL